MDVVAKCFVSFISLFLAARLSPPVLGFLWSDEVAKQRGPDGSDPAHLDVLRRLFRLVDEALYSWRKPNWQGLHGIEYMGYVRQRSAGMGA